MTRFRYSVVFFALLFVIGCEIPSEAPVESIPRVDEFFWKPGVDSFRYDVYAGSNQQPVRHSVWVVFDNDESYAYDLAEDKTGIIRSRVQPQKIVLTDIFASSLFPLPPGAFIAEGPDQQSQKYFLPVSAAYFDQGTALAFNDRAYINSGSTWGLSSPQTNGWIVTVSASRTGVIYAGSVNGGVFRSEDLGRQWTQIRGNTGNTVKSIVVVDSNVFIAIDGEGVFVSRNGSGFIPLAGGLMDSVTGIALVERSSQYSFNWLLATTEKNGLWFCALDGSGGWFTLPTAGISTAQPLTGIYGYKNELSYVITAEGGVFFTSADTGSKWSQYTLPTVQPNEKITSVARTRGGRFAIGTSHGAIWEAFIGGGVGKQLGKVDAHIFDLTFDGETLFISAEDGLSALLDNILSKDVGPFELRPDTTRGEFVLLQSNGSDLHIDDNWLAGYLYLPQMQLSNENVPITARIMERLDTLHAFEESYSDVIAVRYAFEMTPNVLMPDGLHWMIYYSRGIGPVMIDQVRTIANTRESTSRAIYRRQ